MSERERVVILGAAGRDFHNFNVVYRDDPSVEVVAFTAAQIPGIDERRYPPALAGALYPEGIPIEPEERLEEICREHAVGRVVFAYSDVSHAQVMHLASRALACGADFELLGPNRTWLTSRLPVVSVTAARTGSGKSPLSRWIARRLREEGRSVAVLRHPMPYGNLQSQRVQRFASRADLDAANCTVEEREEYESHLAEGSVVFAGVDYGDILRLAEKEADCIVWDGGNNDFGFIKPSVSVAVLDCLRAEQAELYHPGEAVLRMADVIVLSKVDSATPEQVAAASSAARRLNARAEVVHGALPVRLDDQAAVAGKRVLVVEDGPTVTHGGMSHGAGLIAARAGGVAEVLDPRKIGESDLQETLARYPHLGPVVPALGYGPEQVDALRRWIESSGAQVVVSGSPVDLESLLALDIPVVRARYEFEERGAPRLWNAIKRISGIV